MKLGVTVGGALAALGLLAACSPGMGLADKVTMAEFESIQTGMSYQQVVMIVGEAGEKQSEGDMPAIPGVPGMERGLSTVLYTWQNPSGSNMNAMFQNDKLMNKAQFGLK